MVGITSYGVYIPRYRLKRKTIFDRMSWFNSATAGLARGEKAVANYDEDSLTMSVAASLDCLGDLGREQIDGIYLASVSMPYANRQNAAIAATALDLSPGIRTMDFQSSLKAGTSALLAAADAVRAGARKSVLASAADCRKAKIGGSQEMILGDGAASFLLGRDGVIAELLDSHTVSYDFTDLRRGSGDQFDQGWEDRWVRDQGHLKIIPEAVAGLLEKNGWRIGDFARVVIPCHAAATAQAVAGKIGAARDQLQAGLFESMGDTGSAYPLMMLAAALDQANPGDKILVAGFGGGCDVICFRVTGDIADLRRDKVGQCLANREEMDSYMKFLAFRELLPLDLGIRGEITANTSISLVWRDRREIYALCGSRCRSCGTPQFPYQEVCVNPECGAVGQMDFYRFSDRPGKVVSFTGDYLAFSLNPPAIYGFVDFEGGGRFFFDFTDCRLEDVKVGMPVKMTFRRRYADAARAIVGYGWKAQPL